VLQSLLKDLDNDTPQNKTKKPMKKQSKKTVEDLLMFGNISDGKKIYIYFISIFFFFFFF